MKLAEYRAQVGASSVNASGRVVAVQPPKNKRQAEFAAKVAKSKTPKKEKTVSLGEAVFTGQLDAAMIAHECEYRFHPVRRWKFDFAFPEKKVALEVEGGHWTGGRHTRGAGFEGDCEKYAEAACLGWRVIRATTQQVNSGLAFLWVTRALEGVA